MIRLHIVVEGLTEKQFVDSLLVNHLGEFNISTDARMVETSRTQGRVYRGGVIDYPRVKKDLELWMKEDANQDCFFSTMIDLYRLPPAFPGYQDARGLTKPYERVDAPEKAFGTDVGRSRFEPYIQLHEFEALLLADPAAFDAEFINCAAAIKKLGKLVQTHDSPDLVDDTPEGHPARRIIKLLPEYEGRKASAGPLIAERIGLPSIRRRCPHFNSWIARLERLSESS